MKKSLFSVLVVVMMMALTMGFVGCDGDLDPIDGDVETEIEAEDDQVTETDVLDQHLATILVEQTES